MRALRVSLPAAVVACMLVPVLPSAAHAAPTITEYSAGLPSGATPRAVALGSDGKVWFTNDKNPGSLGTIATNGSITSYTAGLSSDGKPAQITSGPGGLWFAEPNNDELGRVTTVGSITEYGGLSGNAAPQGVASGPDGNVWFTQPGRGGAIGRITPAGAITLFTSGLTTNGDPEDIVAGPDGNLWFTEVSAKRVGRITPQGVITEFSTGIAGKPQEITAGPDGNLWFTENGVSPAIGRITPQGVITEFSTGLPLGSAPQSITTGGDGSLYFTDKGANAIGRITTTGVITTFSTGLTAAAGLMDITTGGDGNLWFAEHGAGQLGVMTVAPGAGDVRMTSVTATAATASSTVKPNSQATTVYAEVGTTTAYGTTSASVSAGSGSAPTSVTLNLSGLSANATYHVRMVATNASGTTYGPDRAFTTPVPGAPIATTEQPLSVGATDTTVAGTVNPSSATTTYHFEWGTTSAYGASQPLVDAPAGADGVDHSISETLTGLEPNATYHYRVAATNPSGTTYGTDQTFTTLAVAPDASSDPATMVDGTGATLTATVNPHNTATTYRFEWGATTSYGGVAPAIDAAVGSDNAGHAMTQALSGLDPSTTYHYRVVATSAAGLTYGTDRSFTTAAVAPDAATNEPSAISTSGATLAATVNPRNSATTYRFEWGTSTSYGDSASVSAPWSDAAAHASSHVLSDLSPGTTYHFRVVATSAGGTTYGADRTFTTEAAAPAATDAPSPTGDAAAARPSLGTSVVAGVVRGTVRVRTPGSDVAVVASDVQSLPTGTVVDAREGAIALVSAIDTAGHTQKATFWGGRFTVTQTTQGGGMVDLWLKDAPTGCGPGPVVHGRGPFGSAARRKPPAIRLWGSDNHGRYRTHGRNSAATVRGTRWASTETCAGTSTRVLTGAVSVWDRAKRKSVLVRAGKSYLARPER